MKLNTDKCHFLISGSRYEQMKAELVEDKIWEGSYVKFNFDGYISSIFLKANQKLSALSILAKLLPLARIDYFLKHFLNLSSSIVL